jgi:hypothetical protein
MVATVHMLRPLTPPIAGYLRVGHTGHRKLLDLHAGGRLSFRRIVFDAAYFEEQIELAKTLKASGYEIVLDPNFAEMATINRFGSSSIQKLPWANLGRPWRPEDFDRTRNQDAAKAIAEFAVRAIVRRSLPILRKCLSRMFGHAHPDLAQRPREQVHANSLRQSAIFMQPGDRWSLTWREDLPR